MAWRGYAVFLADLAATLKAATVRVTDCQHSSAGMMIHKMFMKKK